MQERKEKGKDGKGGKGEERKEWEAKLLHSSGTELSG